jgi:putative transposase
LRRASVDLSPFVGVVAVDWRERARRRPTFNEPGHAHELTFSCFRRYQFLRAERTCEWLAKAIEEARKELDFALWAYVFMPEHVHLIVFPRQPVYDVGVIRGAIKEPVSRNAINYLCGHAREWIPKITVRKGKKTEHRFWQSGGGYDRNVTEAAALLAMIEYIHANPVRRGLVAHPRDWKWSSAGWFEGRGLNWLEPDPLPAGVLDGVWSAVGG